MTIILNCTPQLRPQYGYGNLRTGISTAYGRIDRIFQQFPAIAINSTSSQPQFKIRNMASTQGNREELEERARQGETVVPGGTTGGKNLEAQEHLAEGRSRGGKTRKEQLGSEGYHELGVKGGETRKEQIGTEGYQEMGHKGGLSNKEKSGGERAAEEGIEIDESKFKNT